MKKLLLGLCLFAISASAFSCSCEGDDSAIYNDFAVWKGLEHEQIKLSNVESTETPLILYNIGKMIAADQDDYEVQCHLTCSKYGIRITADVEYLEDEQSCKAKLVKPGRYESKLFLDDIVCN